MKMTWKKNVNDTKNKTRKRPISSNPNLPFEDVNSTSGANSTAEPLNDGELLGKDPLPEKTITVSDEEAEERRNLAGQFEAQGNNLAEEGKYREALVKWEAAITLVPEKAILHEQKAQVLLELGEAWNALKAATRAMELYPGWAEAWITLGRAQLNFGEPDLAIESFDKALAIKPDSVEAKEDRQAASHHVQKRKQLHLTGLSSSENRFLVGDEG
ncbi:tetratricopeptide repeat protein 33 isoform X2 [Salvia divinorum]|uniref:Tetratricopeptide repeat protein 33 isoform X2 n=1 Tax=Salvia divinorum TaxID=28513 RepID=A0ABD1FNZ7_SALDI